MKEAGDRGSPSTRHPCCFLSPISPSGKRPPFCVSGCLYLCFFLVIPKGCASDFPSRGTGTEPPRGSPPRWGPLALLSSNSVPARQQHCLLAVSSAEAGAWPFLLGAHRPRDSVLPLLSPFTCEGPRLPEGKKQQNKTQTRPNQTKPNTKKSTELSSSFLEF